MLVRDLSLFLEKKTATPFYRTGVAVFFLAKPKTFRFWI